MAKFKVGDRVVTVKSGRMGEGIPGRKGTIIDPGIGGTRVVQFDDNYERHPVNVEDYNIRRINSRACNAEPKPGDKVFWRNGPFRFDGVFVKKLPGGRNRVKEDGREIDVNGNVYLEGQTPTYTSTPFGRVYNSVRSTNAVVAKALNAYRLAGPHEVVTVVPPTERGTARNETGHKVKVTIKSITDRGLQTFEKVMDVDDLEAWMRSANIGGLYQSVMKQLATMGVKSTALTAMSHIAISGV